MEENVIQINGGITRNFDVSVKNIYKKDHIWNPSTCSSENGRCLASIVDDSVITCDEIIEEETKTVAGNFNEKNKICRTKIFYVYLPFY